MEDVSAIIILFSNALCTQVKRRRVSYHHTCSIALGTQVKRKWRTPQLVPYFFYCFGCSGREKMQDVSLILIVSNTFCLFKSRERGWGFSCYHTFPSTFGIRFKRKWRTSRLSQFFWHFGSPSQETVEDIWVFSIFFQYFGYSVERKWRTSQLLSYFSLYFGNLQMFLGFRCLVIRPPSIHHR